MLAQRLITALYTESMLLADEARHYFDGAIVGRDAMPALDRVVLSCESLKVTTRLMHVIAWLLTQRAIEAGEITAENAREPARRLGLAIASEPDAVGRMPEDAQRLIASSMDLFRRVERLDEGLVTEAVGTSPALQLQNRLKISF